MSEINLVKKLADGRFIFTKEGVYFTLTKEQADLIPLLIEEYEECPEWTEKMRKENGNV